MSTCPTLFHVHERTSSFLWRKYNADSPSTNPRYPRYCTEPTNRNPFMETSAHETRASAFPLSRPACLSLSLSRSINKSLPRFLPPCCQLSIPAALSRVSCHRLTAVCEDDRYSPMALQKHVCCNIHTSGQIAHYLFFPPWSVHEFVRVWWSSASRAKKPCDRAGEHLFRSRCELTSIGYPCRYDSSTPTHNRYAPHCGTAVNEHPPWSELCGSSAKRSLACFPVCSGYPLLEKSEQKLPVLCFSASSLCLYDWLPPAYSANCCMTGCLSPILPTAASWCVCRCFGSVFPFGVSKWLKINDDVTRGQRGRI